MNVLVVGRGKVGRALVAAARGAGVHVRAAAGTRLPRSIDADLVVLAVPDAAVSDAAREVARRAKRPTTLAHVAGRLPPRVLEGARRHGHAVAACHPMLSFADARRAPTVRGATFVVAGDRRAVSALRRFARAIGARVVVASVHGPAYHAAAALIANGGAALAHAGVDVLRALGLRPRDAERTIAGLLRSVAENVERVGVPAALTGPIARGDAETVRRHREALRAIDVELLAAYDAVAPAILRTAVAAGLSPSRARAIRAALRGR